MQEIEGRMREVAAQLGYKDLKSFNAAITPDSRLHAHSRKQILDLYTKYIDQVCPKLPDLFGRLPKAKLEVLPVEEFREKETPGAQYQNPAMDGSRPGHVMVNTGDFEKRSLLPIETIAYHEGVPGHHMQVAVAQEMPRLPPFRQNEKFGAYGEGWALYAERLGKELGFISIPTAITATFRMTCCAPSVWLWTPASIPSIGHASRSWTFFTSIRQWMK